MEISPTMDFRSDTIVFLVTHPGRPTLDGDRGTLETWAHARIASALPDAKFQFAGAEHDFTFPPVNGAKPSGTTESSAGDGIRRHLDQLMHDVMHRDFGAIAEEFRAIFARESSGAADAAQGDRQSGSPQPETANASGSGLGVGIQGPVDPIAVKVPPPFTVMFLRLENVTPTQLVGIAKDMHYQRTSFEAQSQLEQVSLAWYASGGNGGLGSGGPGGRPAPAPSSGAYRHSFRMPDSVEALLDFDLQRGTDVEVAILDTAPSEQALSDAYDGWVTRTNPPHPIMKTLLGQHGKLKCTWYDLTRLKDEVVRDHNYVMSDHGLFVAGIIHSIAPYANLHLVEVLNDHGVGDTESILQGLGDLIKMITAHRAGKKAPAWVVNCSLMTAAPSVEAHLKKMFADMSEVAELSDASRIQRQALLDYLKKEIPDWDKDSPDAVPSEMRTWLLEGQNRAIELVCDYLYAVLHTRVIAAAGNDRLANDPPPAARYPARSMSVLGVGALTSGRQAASYSNTDDDPNSVGVITFGGEVNPPDGVLGAYAGEFPAAPGGAAPPNHSGWAYWAGTSFATPIATGVTAALLSKGGYRDTEAAIDELFNAPHAAGPVPGHFLDVRQL